MTIAIIILTWLLLGALTFGIACITSNTVQSYHKLIVCTMMGLIGLVLLILHIIDEQDQSLRSRVKRAERFRERSLKCIIIVVCAIVFASCGPEPRIHADIVKDQIGIHYYSVNDSVVHNVNNGEYYAFKPKSYQYILIK